MHKSIKEAPPWEGYEFDWYGFTEAIKSRWELNPVGLTHCKLHNTYFDPDGTEEFDGQDAEPCWPCHNEFNKKI